MSQLESHLADTMHTVETLGGHLATIERWGSLIAHVLCSGGRLLAAGNGGSAAEAQHLTAELVGRYRAERRPLSAIALHCETSSLTAIVNDYGPDVAFSRQVEAHGRHGDVLVALSTSGRSRNLLVASARARELGLYTLAVTGPTPNLLARTCHDHIAVVSSAASVVQEAHLVILHLLCEVIDATVAQLEARSSMSGDFTKTPLAHAGGESG